MNPIYLDHGATTPLDPEVAAGLAERHRTLFGNPSSAHPLGRAARQALESARATLAQVMGAAPEGLIFTGGGTESLGLAILGSAGRSAGEILISAVEHSAVREAAGWLAEHKGWDVVVVPVDDWGRVTPDALAERVSARTRIVAVMLANNEVGTINDIPALVRVVRAQAPRARFVVDAVQALGKIPLSVTRLGADHVAVTAHKLHGPKAVGALWSKRPLEPVFKGGGQERGQRGGTQSAPLAWAFAEAARRHLQDTERITALRDRLWGALQSALPGITLNGAPIGPHRLGNNLHVRVPGLPSEPLLNALSAAGVYASAGSACSAGKFSRVLGAMGFAAKDGAFIRLTPGRFTTEAEIDSAATRFITAVEQIGGAYG